MIRTPHGDADVVVLDAPPSTDLAQLIGQVTGQAPPPAAHVDGRAVITSTRLVDLDLHIGSVIDAGAARPGRGRPVTVGGAALPPPGSPAPAPPPAATQPAGSVGDGADEPADGAESTPPSQVILELTQLTGRGAGRQLRLGPGRYRVGPGRRLVAGELGENPVEQPAFEVVVDADGSATVRPGPRSGSSKGILSPMLAGRSLVADQEWTTGRLSVAGRLFDLRPPSEGMARPRARPDHRGRIPFHRSSVRPTYERLVADATALARGRLDGLWTKRPTLEGSLPIPIGFGPDGETLESVDMVLHSGLAVVGSDEFTAAMARGLLVMAATSAGPADLDIAIASSSARLAHWDWAKWLPHARTGEPGAGTAVYSSRGLLADWADRLLSATADLRYQRARSERGSRFTLLVLDDRDLWSTRESPVRSLLVDPPPGLRILVLCSAMSDTPGSCSAVIEEVTAAEGLASVEYGPSPVMVGSLARLHERGGAVDSVSELIRPALVEDDVAVRIARGIAPLDDLADERPPDDTRFEHAPTLADVLHLADELEPPRWVDPDAAVDDSLRVVIGRLAEDTPLPPEFPPPRDGAASGGRTPDREPPGAVPRARPGDGGAPRSERLDAGSSDAAVLDLSGVRSTFLGGLDVERRSDVLASIVLGACMRRDVDGLAILSVGRRTPAWFDELPQVAGIVVAGGDDDVRRVSHRIRRVIDEHRSLQVLVVVEAGQDRIDDRETAFQSPDADGRYDFLRAMLDLAAELERVHVLAVGGEPIEVVARATGHDFDAVIELAPGTGRSTIAVGGHTDRFVPVVRAAGLSGARSGTLRIRPVVLGRPMTPLERRLVRREPAGAPDEDSVVIDVADLVADRSSPGRDQPGPLVPPVLPHSTPLRRMLDRFGGDGVPLGLVDRPAAAEHTPYWWDPEKGETLIAVGSPRSGVTALVDVVTVGVAARVDPAELSVYAIEPLPQRRRALEQLPHAASVTSTDDPIETDRVVSEIEAIAARRRRDGRHRGDPTILLLVGDLGRLRRWLPTHHDSSDGSVPPTSEEGVMARLGALAVDGPEVGIRLVVITSRANDLGPLRYSPGDRLIGELQDPSESAELGAPRGFDATGQAGRCWSVDEGQLVQLATAPRSPERAVHDLLGADLGPARGGGRP
ncbi:MAG: hypothetical protein AAGD33_05730 [Actinomycetota bacterium]